MNSVVEVLDEGQVVIVGAGPAGTAAAITLARLGREVLLIDQNEFPRDKPCGDALSSVSVKMLLDLGLDELISSSTPIEGVRASRLRGERSHEHRFADRKDKILPGCIARKQLDSSLFEAAIESGVRFIQGRVQEAIEIDGRVSAVVVHRNGKQHAEVRAKNFIAADGVTSRMRQLIQSGASTPGPHAFAIRQYFRTEHAVDPMFEVQVPLVISKKAFRGYSWIFPLDERVVNIGVAFFDDPFAGRADLESRREVFERSAQEIVGVAWPAGGDLESLSKPYGAPLAVNFSASAIERNNVLFVGDAAQMANPLTGEGIASALRSGIEAARSIDDRLRGEAAPSFGRRIFSVFPDLGQDMCVVDNNFDGLIADEYFSRGDALGDPVIHPLLITAIRELAWSVDEDSAIETTPVFNHAVAKIESVRDQLFAINQLVLDTVRTDFPFALDMLHRQLRSKAGPTLAATLLLASGDERSDELLAAGMACELLKLATHFLSQAIDDDVPGHVSLGNGLTTLIADHALSNSLLAVSTLGPAETARFSRMSLRLFEGAAADADDAWDLGRTLERYLDAVDDQDGSIHGYVAELAARLAGSEAAADPLFDFGRNFGIALRISNDVVELFAGDGPTAGAPGDSLRNGNYSMPVIFALRDDPALTELLAPEAIEDSVEEVLTRIRATDAIDLSVAECNRYVEAATAALRQTDTRAHGLTELATMPATRCSEFLTDTATWKAG